VLGEGFVEALKPHRTQAKDESPYRDGI